MARLTFAKATASGGFQMVALNAMSYGADAISSTVARPRASEVNRRQMATKSRASAADWMMDNPMLPACGRFCVHGPTRWRMAQTVQTKMGPSVVPPTEVGPPPAGRLRHDPSAHLQYRIWSPSNQNDSVTWRVRMKRTYANSTTGIATSATRWFVRWFDDSIMAPMAESRLAR